MKMNEYLAKYKLLDVDDIANTYASLNINRKRQWAFGKDNMKDIARSCRSSRRYRSNPDSDW
jgi:hypothetical protein